MTAIKVGIKFHTIVMFKSCNIFVQGHAVAYLVEALYYKPEGRGFDSG
jgi:hypothetical protein